MSGLMQATRRGRKHRCGACGAAFYDLERDLSACPKCEMPYAVTGQMPRGEPARKRQSWSKRGRQPEPEAVPEAPAARASEGDIEGAPILDAADDADDAEAADHTDEENQSAEDQGTEDDEAPG